VLFATDNDLLAECVRRLVYKKTRPLKSGLLHAQIETWSKSARYPVPGNALVFMTEAELFETKAKVRVTTLVNPQALGIQAIGITFSAHHNGVLFDEFDGLGCRVSTFPE